jgi:GntR family transcriptional regulator / MocR family aminotransferase
MPRKSKVVELPALTPLNRQAGQLSRQLAASLKRAVETRSIQAGELLPSTRVLAAALGVSRGTVIEAYEQLVAEGFFEAKEGAGTYVLHDLKPHPVALKCHAEETRAPALSERGLRFAAAAGQITTLPQKPFAVSVPENETQPGEIWRRLGNRIRAKGQGVPAGYGSPAGVEALREAVADYVRRARSVRCHAGQVIITAGTQQGLYIASQVLLDQGDKAWVEDPAYPGLTGIFKAAGLAEQLCRVPVDSEGINVELAEQNFPDARAAFVTPSHQYPLGMPLSMGRRARLVEWARKKGAWIVEDDYDSEFRYNGHPFPAMQGMAPDSVIYLGTFSKVLFPSLRLGYAVVPDIMVDAWCGARLMMDRHSPEADQHVLAAYMNEGHLDRHIRRLRGVYAEKRAILCQLLEQHICPAGALIEPCDQGMHLVLWLPDGINDVELARTAAESGIAVRAVSPMYAALGRSGLMLGLGGYSARNMESAVVRLRDLIRNKGGIKI